MVHRHIDLDEESDRILVDLAVDYNGDIGQALSSLLHTHQDLETFLSESEAVRSESLADQKARSEVEFEQRKVLSWDEVKRQNGL